MGRAQCPETLELDGAEQQQAVVRCPCSAACLSIAGAEFHVDMLAALHLRPHLSLMEAKSPLMVQQ